MTVRLPDRAGSNILIIGAASFAAKNLSDLPAVANNVRALASVLTNEVTGILDARRCVVLLDPFSPAEVGLALKKAVAGAADTVIVYYAGHGVLNQDGKLHLAVRNTDPESVDYTAVPMDWVRSALARSPASNRILLLDCCYSGQATETMTSMSSALTAAIDISGTYTIASAPATRTAIAPAGEQYTAFTGELLKVLHLGITNAGDLLSLRDTYTALVRALRSRAMPSPQHLSTGQSDLIAIGRNHATTVPSPPPPPPRALSDFGGALLSEMAAFPRRKVRPGYCISDVQQWAAAVADPTLRRGTHWPGAPTAPLFRRQFGGWDCATVDAFTARYTPFTSSPMFGDGGTAFAVELRATLAKTSSCKPAQELNAEQVKLLRYQLRLPDDEQLVGGIVAGAGQATEYLYFTNWGLRARNDTVVPTGLLRNRNYNEELMSISHEALPLATFRPGEHLNAFPGEASIGNCMWYEVDISFKGRIFKVLSASSGRDRAELVARDLNRIKDLCEKHLGRYVPS